MVLKRHNLFLRGKFTNGLVLLVHQHKINSHGRQYTGWLMRNIFKSKIVSERVSSKLFKNKTKLSPFQKIQSINSSDWYWAQFFIKRDLVEEKKQKYSRKKPNYEFEGKSPSSKKWFALYIEWLEKNHEKGTMIS